MIVSFLLCPCPSLLGWGTFVSSVNLTIHEEKAMPSIVDKTYRWTGFGNGLGNWASHCRIRIFRPHPEQIVVIASDLGEDSGTSITNCAEGLATLVVRDFGLDLPCFCGLNTIHTIGRRTQKLNSAASTSVGVVAKRPRPAGSLLASRKLKRSVVASCNQARTQF